MSDVEGCASKTLSELNETVYQQTTSIKEISLMSLTSHTLHCGKSNHTIYHRMCRSVLFWKLTGILCFSGLTSSLAARRQNADVKTMAALAALPCPRWTGVKQVKVQCCSARKSGDQSNRSLCGWKIFSSRRDATVNVITRSALPANTQQCGNTTTETVQFSLVLAF